MAAISGDSRESEWLRQRCSIAVVRGNAASVLLTANRTSDSQECKKAANPSRDEPSDDMVTKSNKLSSGRESLTGVSSRAYRSPPLPPFLSFSKELPAQPLASQWKTGEAGKALQQNGGLAQAPVLEPVPASNPSQLKYGSDPLHIGLPNLGNSCYQNATLQLLLGLRPFLSEMVALAPTLDDERCRTLRAVARLMELRQSARVTSISNHLNDLRDVFARIDPAFRGTEVQDANEFLLRLLDTIKEEVDDS